MFDRICSSAFVRPSASYRSNLRCQIAESGGADEMPLRLPADVHGRRESRSRSRCNRGHGVVFAAGGDGEPRRWFGTRTRRLGRTVLFPRRVLIHGRGDVGLFQSRIGECCRRCGEVIAGLRLGRCCKAGCNRPGGLKGRGVGNSNGDDGGLVPLEASRVTIEDGERDRVPGLNPPLVIPAAGAVGEESKKGPPRAGQNCHNLWTISEFTRPGNPNACFLTFGFTSEACSR